MAGVLLALFPVLLMFDTRVAFAALAAGIVLLCSQRLSAARRVVRPRIENDSSI
jgi:hypothetical protein